MKHANKEAIKLRTKQFALRIIQLVQSLPRNQTAAVIGRQLLRSGTSVGANYRSACRARSTADFISKIGIVEEEADESLFWMELLVENNLMKKEKLELLMQEADEILAITVSSIKTAKSRKKQYMYLIRIPKSEIRNQTTEGGGYGQTGK